MRETLLTFNFQIVAHQIMTTLQKGDNAPQFSALDEKGNIIQLKDYSGKKIGIVLLPKGKYTRLYSGSLRSQRQLQFILRKRI